MSTSVNLVMLPSDLNIGVNPDEHIAVDMCNADVSDDACEGGTSEKVVAWISLDPRQGRLVFYPEDVARRLEEMYETNMLGISGSDAVNLGDSFCGAVVFLNRDSELPLAIQRTSRGRRDVHRLELRTADTESLTVTLFGVQTARGWRIASATDPSAEQLHADIPPDAICTCKPQSAINMSLRSTEISSAIAVASAIPREGEAVLWEWCLQVTHDVDSLPKDAWGVYSPDLNNEIEAAYQEGASTVNVQVGVREFQIIFGEAFGHPGTARQVDQVYRKKRHVRRRLVSVAERDEKLQAAPEEDKDATCAICFQEFADTRAMPSLRLRECNHRFHAACVQNLIDTAKPCPYCRCDVDWNSACLH